MQASKIANLSCAGPDIQSGWGTVPKAFFWAPTYFTEETMGQISPRGGSILVFLRIHIAT